MSTSPFYIINNLTSEDAEIVAAEVSSGMTHEAVPAGSSHPHSFTLSRAQTILPTQVAPAFLAAQTFCSR